MNYLYTQTLTHCTCPQEIMLRWGASLIVSPARAGRPEASYTNHYIKSVIQPAAVRRGGIFKHILHFHMHADLLLLLTNHITQSGWLTQTREYNQTKRTSEN